MTRFTAICAASLALAACSAAHDASLPGDSEDDQPLATIGADEVVYLTGTEPFWGGQIAGELLTYTTPENQAGQRLAVTRFAGRGGLSFSGQADGDNIDIAITPAPCSDGMSDRTYPYNVTLQWGVEQRTGCGWTDAQPHSGG